ncbi:MAG: Xaa-Pro peptidase family protein [Pseudomonadota bacterium]
MIYDASFDRATPISDEERKTRRDLLRDRVCELEYDALLLTPGSNMRYFFGLAWRATERLVAAMITPSRVIFICPKFEDSALLAVIGDRYETEWWEEHEDPAKLVTLLVHELGIQRLGIDPQLSYGLAHRLVELLSDCQCSDGTALVAPLRYRKSDAEIALLKSAKQLTLHVHQRIFEWIKPGIRASEIATMIDQLHRNGGADDGSTFCSVQFGTATAHPHGIPGDPELVEADIVLIDTGCQLDGYHSDITRTYALAKQPAAVEAHWALEKEAQRLAFEAAQLGVYCEEVDKTARAALAEAGLGPDYQLPGLPHRTGHGIGLDIHEGPYLVRGDRTELAPGMCFSNEPMIVVPEQYGIRLEDHFYMTEEGPQWFTEPQPDLYQPFS